MRPLVAKVERIDGSGSDWVCGSPWTLSTPPFGLPSFLHVDFQAGSEEEAQLRLAAEGCRVGDPVYTSCSDVLIWCVEEEL